MTIVPNSLHEPTVKTDTKFVDFCRDVQKSQVDVEMFPENRAKLPHITLPANTPLFTPHRPLGKMAPTGALRGFRQIRRNKGGIRYLGASESRENYRF